MFSTPDSEDRPYPQVIAFCCSYAMWMGYRDASVGTQKKDIDAAVREILDHGWTEATGKGYRKFRCPCGRHQKTVKHSPSDANYIRNLMAWFRRQPCWKEGEGK